MSEPPVYRPAERFWPYADLPEQPSDEELAALDPDLRAALLGTPPLPFSLTIVFPRFEGEAYERAAAIARAAAEYREMGEGEGFRHRARFFPAEVERLRDLYQLVNGVHGTDVLIDDKPVPYARELWLPLVWFLLR
ncbi:MAG: hypothetical protein M3R55_10940 [Acidobacteriota bacterium]|nr:hypothetical protein [Acidobacteriota bacterium]